MESMYVPKQAQVGKLHLESDMFKYLRLMTPLPQLFVWLLYRSYRQGLTLELNGVDVSCLDVKETQSRIDRLVDGTLLPHTVFFGQHMGAGRGLLDSTDRTLKEHLALVFPLDVWKEARKRSRMKLLKRQENQVSLEASLEAGKALVSRIQIGEASSNKQLDQFESQRKQRLLDIDNRINEMITSRRRVDEDSIWFSESFAVSNSSDEVNAVLEDTRRALRSLDEPKKDGLEQARSAAEVEMARLMAALAADEELDARLSSLVTRALDYEKKTETKRANIEAFMLSLKQEVDRCPSPAEIDMRWKECLEKSRKCDEKMQALVGINIRNGEGHNFNGISDLLSSVDAARSKAFKLQDEKVRLRTSLHEIRHRLLQSEEFSLFKSENYETETPIIAVPHSSLVTCEKCLRPFDGVLYEEARSKLEVEARSVEQAISSAEDLWEQEKECLDAAVRNVEDRIEREKSAIVEEKKAMNARMGKLRLVQQTRTSLNREMNEYLTQLEQLRAEPNLYMEELRALNIVTLPSSSSVSECTDIVNEFMFKKLERSLITITEAESAYSHIMEQVQKRRREELDLISKQKSLQELLEDLQGLQADCRILEGERNSIATEKNPYEEAVRRQQKDINRESALVQKREKENAELSDGINVMKALDVAFGPRGVPSFVLEEGLTWLEKATDKYLHLLSAGELLLQIRAFSDYKSSYRADGENKEVISKKIFVRNPNSSALRERSLRQLSGGQRRRCSLAFALAFADLAHERAGFQSSLLVLDEILQSLDQDGRQRMSRVLPKLFEESHGQRNTVVVVAQDEAPEIAGFAHGGVDVVERRSNQSTVFLDGKTSAE